jgi:general secretion pathway protein D
VGTPARSGDQVLTQIFKLQHENPNNLVAVLRPLITANNTINASPASNSLVITDYADNLQRLGRIIEALDQPSGSELEVVPLKNAVASDIVQLVQKLVDGGTVQTPGVPGTTAQTSILVDPRTNSLIIRAANATRMAQARMIVDKLDQPTAGGGPAGNIWVVYLKNADATKIAEVLRAAIASGSVGGSGGAGGGSGNSGNQGSAFGNGTRDTTTSSSSTTSTSGSTGNTASPQSTNPVSASAHPSTGGQVQADPATNSLIITASEPLYRQMRQVIDQLDVRRAQVYVEALMVTMDEKKAAQMGFQWQNLFGRKGDSTITGAGTNFGSQTNFNNILFGSAALVNGSSGVVTAANSAVSSAGSAISNGLNIGIIKNLGSYYTLGALAQFLESNTGANVLATPNLIAMDNEEAKIVVGQNIPLVTGSYTNTGTTSSGSVNPFQTVERQDVGITLRIKSSIGENGTVRMTIYEENSSVAPGTGGQTTNKTSYEGYVTVDDGSLIVLGGLISDEYDDGVDQVPLLGSIPIIGNLFKSQNRSREKRNLMLFLRPVVMRSQSDADAITLNRYDAIRRQQEITQPDKNVVLRVNDAPVIPRIGADTRVLPTPQDAQDRSVKMPNVDPLPDLHRPGAIYGPAGAQPLPPQAPQATFVPLGQMAPVAPQPGASTTTTTTTTTVAPAPAASVPTK